MSVKSAGLAEVFENHIILICSRHNFKGIVSIYLGRHVVSDVKAEWCRSFYIQFPEDFIFLF